MAEVTMPRLSDTMSEGAVQRWLKKPGDAVQTDEVIAEIETDKATMELVAFESGTLQEIRVPEGQVVPIGTVIGVIGDGAAQPAAAPAAKTADAAPATPAQAQAEAPAADAKAPAAEAADPAAAAASAPAQPAAAAATQAAPAQAGSAPAAVNGAENGDRIKASPVARRMAEDLGVNLREVQGTGPQGRILRANVEAFRKGDAAPAAAPAAAGQARPTLVSSQPAPAAGAAALTEDVAPMSRMRKAIAKAMTDSKPGIPHIYLTAEIDMAAAQALRAQINESGASDVKISPNDLIVKAVAKALLKFPSVNASYATTAEGQPAVAHHGRVNVSVAVATDNGLLAPVVHDADKKTVSAIAAEIRELAGRAREGKVKSGDLDGATFQTSNLGMFGITEFVSIITPPQAASLAIGEIRQTPVVRDGQIVVGSIMNVTLSVDHRVADGAAGAQFLQEVTRLLQAPLSLLV